MTDINLMYDIDWSDAGNDYKAYGMPTLIGDQVKDADQLKATSPLLQAARITRPLMLAHGGLDRRVPMEHAKSLRDALEARQAPLTWVFYPDEGHGEFSPANRADWFRKMEAFLAANLAVAPAGAVSGAAR